MKGILIVRKYKNRRLYDTEQSIHITRDQLLETIRGGRVVQIQEASSGEDVTVETLFQLLLDQGGPALNTAVPADFVHFLIRTGEAELGRFFQDFLPMATQAFQANLRTMQDQGRRVAEAFFPYAQYGAPWLLPWQAAGLPATQPPVTAPSPAASSATADEVGQLRERLQELEAQLAGKAPKARKRKTSEKP
ncbi:MAG: hypothetical protein HY814_09915 [Candidatus Riflebacteria bacterium]|nr:hypothetical protein [Candidatus Riflebacteria bacterium]